MNTNTFFIVAALLLSSNSYFFIQFSEARRNSIRGNRNDHTKKKKDLGKSQNAQMEVMNRVLENADVVGGASIVIDGIKLLEEEQKETSIKQKKKRTKTSRKNTTGKKHKKSSKSSVKATTAIEAPATNTMNLSSEDREGANFMNDDIFKSFSGDESSKNITIFPSNDFGYSVNCSQPFTENCKNGE